MIFLFDHFVSLIGHGMLGLLLCFFFLPHFSAQPLSLPLSMVVMETHQSASSLWSTVGNLCTLTRFIKRDF